LGFINANSSWLQQAFSISQVPLKVGLEGSFVLLQSNQTGPKYLKLSKAKNSSDNINHDDQRRSSIITAIKNGSFSKITRHFEITRESGTTFVIHLKSNTNNKFEFSRPKTPIYLDQSYELAQF